ncbi:LacI family DNA-binding transcriptional regulator [Longispora albida]|uniref:LacI family DNA-binding transcriptional regulator n=1 Tax=Longispora albida TaxID=203523 RepID=UPI000374DD78|nr:LacI family DNA-binding transcriptional regulator [Longispora albida]
MKERPTLEEVARRAGVGRGTVSRVINGSPRASEQARAAVNAAIAELGYIPNRAARSLVTRRTDSVALVVPESEERFFTEPFFGRVVRGVSAGLRDSEVQLLLAIAQDRRRLGHYLTRQHVDGVILLSLHGEDPLPGELESRGVPAVLIGRPLTTPAAYVDADNAGGARLAVEHLAASGRRRIGILAGPQDMAVGVARLAGATEALAAAGLPADLVAYGDFSEASGAAALRELLDTAPDLDAVFAASDPMAAGALRVLRSLGRAVPGDVAVAGFDDSVIAEHADPPLTSVHQPVEAMGTAAVRLLLDRIAGTAPDRPAVVLDTHLTIRQST